MLFVCIPELTDVVIVRVLLGAVAVVATPFVVMTLAVGQNHVMD